MAFSRCVLTFGTLSAVALLCLACLPAGPSARPTSTPVAVVQSTRTASATTATPPPSPTLPVLPALSTYTVQSGDYPMLIAENAGVPAGERDAWVEEMLALNGVEATSLQIGQKLILPPAGVAFGPRPSPTTSSGVDSAPPAAPVVVEPTATSTPKPSSPFAGGVPFAATPPFIGGATSTPTPTATPKITPTPNATAIPTPIPAGDRAWLTSSDATAKYYYCDLDSGWTNIPSDKLIAFDSEEELLAIWGRHRTKAPDSVC